MKIRHLTTLLLGLLLIGLVSCEYVTIEPNDVVLPDEPVSFATQVAPVFVNAGCTGCHSGGTAPDLRADKSYNSLTTGNYVNVSDPASSKIVMKINSGHGTSNTISATDKALLLKWIEEGANNN